MNNYNFISLSVKCPVCGVSLMDNDHKVDNEPSVRLLIKDKNHSGTISLSSIYGSYNFNCDVELAQNEIAVFTCPHCNAEITAKENCTDCEAPLASLVLDMGGKISFCTRNGCKNHNIGFEDLSSAMSKLYQEFGHHGHHSLYQRPVIKTPEKINTEEEDHQEILKTGTYLQSYCPHCRKTLIENDMLKFKITNNKGEVGFINLSPILNVFSSKSTIFLPEDEKLGEIRCFHCDKSLIISDGTCERCGTSIAKILVSARTKMIDFYLCAKKGCTWHGLSKSDLHDIRLEDSLEW